MSRSTVAFLALTSGLLSFSVPAQAQYLGFLSESVLSEFAPEEVASFKQTIKQALESEPDAKVIPWRSPTSELAGKILPKISFEADGQPCRRTAFKITQGEARKEYYRFDICKDADGWGVVEPGFKFSKKELGELKAFIQQVLEEEPDKYPSHWSSTESGKNLVLVPYERKDHKGAICRDTAAVLTTGDQRSVSGQYRFCVVEGQWLYSPDA